MKFIETRLKDAYILEMEPREDERGFFARAYCEAEFAAAGLSASRFVQINNSYNRKAGTLRGMHYQLPPASEVKIVRCLHGALYDVIIDLRPDSPSCGQWLGVELSAENRRSLYVPRGFAHGFISLRDDTEALYLASDAYMPGQERGLRYDDPRFGVEWPMAPVSVSEKDLSWPAFDPSFHRPEALLGLR
jgi:dTDP-4-dehydrorhamnose 3,5-epimerase